MLVSTRWRVSLRRYLSFALLAFVLSQTPCHAQAVTNAPVLPANSVAGMPELKAIGGGLLRIFGFQIYNAYLWTPSGGSFDRSKPYVLDIHYLRTFSAKQLAERSIDEMRGQGTGSEAIYPKWVTEMQRVFADVKEGDRLTGVATPTRTAKFFYNGTYRGEIADSAFADAFFGIWLSEKSSQPKMRNQLLGKAD
jgi:Chalcone isomerase-like